MYLDMWFSPHSSTFMDLLGFHSADGCPQPYQCRSHDTYPTGHFTFIDHRALNSDYLCFSEDIKTLHRGPQVGHIHGQGFFVDLNVSIVQRSLTRYIQITSVRYRVIPQTDCLVFQISTGSTKRADVLIISDMCLTSHTLFSHFEPHFHRCTFPSKQWNHDWKRSTRIGEAQNPGPEGSTTTTTHLTFSLLNPTTIYQKEDDLLGLNSDILCLAETAATRNVQTAFNQAIRTTKYHTYWSAPVPDKITKTDPTLGYTLRGDNLGTAILTRLPSRDARHTFTPSAWETCRMNSAIVSTGVIDVLVVSTYFHTGKSAEARIVNNQLLQDILHHVLSTDLPFVIAGDFNMDIQKLDAWPVFGHMGCCEMFDFHRRAFGFELPPTCKGATRFDSMILHPTLLPHIFRIDIGPEHQFADHCAVHVQLNLPTTHVASQTWFVPRSWTLFNIDRHEFAHQYRRVRRSCPVHVSDDASTSLYRWSAQTEKAVDLVLQSQHRLEIHWLIVNVFCRRLTEVVVLHHVLYIVRVHVLPKKTGLAAMNHRWRLLPFGAATKFDKSAFCDVLNSSIENTTWTAFLLPTGHPCPSFLRLSSNGRPLDWPMVMAIHGPGGCCNLRPLLQSPPTFRLRINYTQSAKSPNMMPTYIANKKPSFADSRINMAWN